MVWDKIGKYIIFLIGDIALSFTPTNVSLREI